MSDTNSDPDYLLAMMLQEQFKYEANVNSSVNDLTYGPRKKEVPTECLTDASWELVDPTPNIHALFVQFNERFFWSKLVTVAVSWSKRMTSCAGICSYQGRGGLCRVTLSEPLLKLRPRKDLVETLLHEMIHAYLFVTHNNRDRDGHGPEFHKHMHRINDAAGTRITVYHSFHDEVRLYQQHWWRCDGPCQQRKPFFGIVRRATNRAPGHNDRWWADHQRLCGGRFVKVREPEGFGKEKRKTRPTKNASHQKDDKVKAASTNDIRKYLPPVIVEKANVTPLSAASSKIVSLTDLNRTTNPSSSDGTTSGSNVVAFAGTGQKLSPDDDDDDDNTDPTSKRIGDSYDAVRNHWLNKYDDAQATTSTGAIPKKRKYEDYLVCPVCNKEVPELELNEHLDRCLAEPTISDDKSQSCFICNKAVPMDELPRHVEGCLKTIERGAEAETCAACGDTVDNIGEHLKQCLESAFSDSPASEEYTQLTLCDVCDNLVPSDEMPRHAEHCFHEYFDDMEGADDLKSSDVRVPCLVCNETVLRSELNDHLEDCTHVFKNDDDDDDESMDTTDPAAAAPIEVSDDDECDAADDGAVQMYNCPFCLERFVAAEMNVHLDGCLLPTVGEH